MGAFHRRPSADKYSENSSLRPPFGRARQGSFGRVRFRRSWMSDGSSSGNRGFSSSQCLIIFLSCLVRRGPNAGLEVVIMPRNRAPTGDQSLRLCSQCKAMKNDGRHRCSRRTCKYGPLCWQHTQTRQGLEVKKSHIPGAGLGLFAKKEIPARQKIATYGGEILTQRQLDQRYPGRNTLAQYALETGENTHKFVDARATNSGVARYANDCRPANQAAGHCTGNNATLAQRATPRRPRVRPVLQAGRRAIPKGKEITTSYGAEYWAEGVPRVPPRRPRKRGRARRG